MSEMLRKGRQTLPPLNNTEFAPMLLRSLDLFHIDIRLRRNQTILYSQLMISRFPVNIVLE